MAARAGVANVVNSAIDTAEYSRRRKHEVAAPALTLPVWHRGTMHVCCGTFDRLVRLSEIARIVPDRRFRDSRLPPKALTVPSSATRIEKRGQDTYGSQGRALALDNHEPGEAPLPEVSETEQTRSSAQAGIAERSAMRPSATIQGYCMQGQGVCSGGC